jgi:hypothetical protein
MHQIAEKRKDPKAKASKYRPEMILINGRLHTWYLPRNWNFTEQKFFSLVGNTKNKA